MYSRGVNNKVVQVSELLNLGKKIQVSGGSTWKRPLGVNSSELKN